MSNAMLKYIEADLPAIQAFMEANIGDGRKMTAAAIYEAVKDDLTSDVNENTFKSSLSANVKAGNIKGFEGKRKVGYVKIGDDEVASTTKNRAEVEAEEAPRFGIQITKSIRVILADRYNFTRQKFTSAGWTNQTYYSTLGEALRSTTQYLIEEKLRTKDQVTDIKDVASILHQVESSIMGELVEQSKGMPLDKKAAQLTAEDIPA